MTPVGGIVGLILLVRFLINSDKNKTGAPARAGAGTDWHTLFLFGMYILPVIGCAVGAVSLCTWIGARHPGILPDETETGIAFLSALLGLVGGIAAVSVWPRWWAWRVLRRWPALARAGLWLSIGARPAERAGFGRVVTAGAGLPIAGAGEQPLISAVRRWRRAPPISPPVPFDAWTACALALESERAGDAERADRWLSLLEAATSASGRRPSRFLRICGLETLAWQAARRGDWAATARRAHAAAGRAAWALRLLARARGGGLPVARWRLLAAFLFAPERRQGLALLRDVGPRARVSPDPDDRPVARDLGLHLQLLETVGCGGAPQTATLEGLVASLAPRLSAEEGARFCRRGLELDARYAEAGWQALRSELLDELGWLFSAVHGPALRGGGELRDELRERQRRRSEEQLEALYARFADGALQLGTPVEEAVRWMESCKLVSASGMLADAERLHAAWFAGLRLLVWDWPAKLFNQYGPKAAWLCALMFDQAVALGTRCGDADAVRVNSENLKVVRAAMAP